MNERGAALIIVLVLVVLLSVLVIEFAYVIRVDARILDYRHSDRAAYHLGRGGVNIAKEVLRLDSPMVDSLNDIWAVEFPPLADDAGIVVLTITDEDSKINVNAIVDAGGLKNDRAYAMLERLLDNAGADAGLAEAALSEILSRGGTGYSTKREFLDMEGAEVLAEYITVYTDGRININTAPDAVIAAISDSIDASLAREIVLARNSAPFGSLSQLARIPGMTEEALAEISQAGKVSSGIFTIDVAVAFSDRVKNIVAVVERRRNAFRVLYWRAV